MTGRKIKIQLNNVQDFRNYKVTCERARMMLGFLPKYSVPDIIHALDKHRSEYGDFSSDEYSNIAVFKRHLLPKLRVAA